MSFNVSKFKITDRNDFRLFRRTLENDGWRLSIKDGEDGIKRFHFRHDMAEECLIIAVSRDEQEMVVEEINFFGAGSGHSLPRLLQTLRWGRGRLAAYIVWEEGDSIESITIIETQIWHRPAVIL